MVGISTNPTLTTLALAPGEASQLPEIALANLPIVYAKESLTSKGFFRRLSTTVAVISVTKASQSAGAPIPPDLQAVRLAPLQGGQNHRFEMPPQLIALNRFHVFILDKLGINVKS